MFNLVNILSEEVYTGAHFCKVYQKFGMDGREATV